MATTATGLLLAGCGGSPAPSGPATTGAPRPGAGSGSGTMPSPVTKPAPGPTPVAAADPAACDDTSYVAGTTALCAGKLVYRDYVYDDYGAANGRTNMPYSAATLSFSAGGAKYPTGAENTADLLRFELSLDGDQVVVRYVLNTLFQPAQTLAALAIDTDDDATTGGGTLPGLGVSAPGWDVFRTFATGDVQANEIVGRLPRPAGGTWKVYALVAQADGTVMNVAFRGPDELARSGLTTKDPASAQPGSGSFFEDRQAAALQNKDIGAFGQAVAVADLAGGVTRPPVVGPGLHERVYTSAFTVPRTAADTAGEGVAPAGVPGRGSGGSLPLLAQNFVFLGAHQPYAVYLPKTLAGQTAAQPLQMVFHGSGAAHSSQVNQPGFQAAFGEGLGRRLVSPLGRGPSGYGSDYAERDLLDVMADAEAHYPTDAGRVIASGYSQGGYITFRMCALYPQVFAGFVEWVGVTGNRLRGTPVDGELQYNAGIVGDMIDYLGNLRHIPGAMLHGGEDELAPLPATRATQQAFAATDDVYEWFLHPVAEHLSFLAFDDWGKEAAYTRDFRRRVDPPRVSFRTDPALGNAALGIAHDRAYWASGIVTRDAGAGSLDLTSHGCGGSLPTTATGSHQGTDPVPWTSDYRAATGAMPMVAEPLLEGSLANLSALRIDAAATCLAGQAVRYALTTDGATRLALGDGRTLDLPAAGRYAGVLPP